MSLRRTSVVLPLLFALVACKAHSASVVASTETPSVPEQRSLMDPALWEPAGYALSPVFPGTSIAWMKGDVWTLPGRNVARETVVHQGKIRPNHMQFTAKTKQNFGAFRLSFSFFFEPEDTSKLSPTFVGNTGIYIFGLYEVQIFRSGFFDGRPTVPRDGVPQGHVASQFFCGSVYNEIAPTAADGSYYNACADDGVWHDMVVTFHPAVIKDGITKAAATVQVAIDGVPLSYAGQTVHPIAGPTGSQRGRPETALGPIFLQDHGSSVSFRNIAVESLP